MTVVKYSRFGALVSRVTYPIRKRLGVGMACSILLALPAILAIACGDAVRQLTRVVGSVVILLAGVALVGYDKYEENFYPKVRRERIEQSCMFELPGGRYLAGKLIHSYYSEVYFGQFVYRPESKVIRTLKLTSPEFKVTLSGTTNGRAFTRTVVPTSRPENDRELYFDSPDSLHVSADGVDVNIGLDVACL